MEPIYNQLAQHLDNLPGGYPATESGIELRILKRLFTPEEAEIAVHLTLKPEPAAAIAQRIGADETTLAPKLIDMSHKGLIIRLERKGELKFMAAQFMVGIWEYHVNDLDEGLIKDVNEYLPYLTEAQEQVRTQQLRVIPISKILAADIKVMPSSRQRRSSNNNLKLSLLPASAAESIRWSVRAAINPWKPAWCSAAVLIFTRATVSDAPFPSRRLWISCNRASIPVSCCNRAMQKSRQTSVCVAVVAARSLKC